jgi:hypothetical protein
VKSEEILTTKAQKAQKVLAENPVFLFPLCAFVVNPNFVCVSEVRAVRGRRMDFRNSSADR